MATITAAQVANPAALQVILNELLTDIAAISTSFAAITTKLDADGAITATNWGNEDPAALITTRPSAPSGGNPTSDPAVH